MTLARRQVLTAGAAASVYVWSASSADATLLPALWRPHSQERLPTLDDLGVIDLTSGGTARLSTTPKGPAMHSDSHPAIPDSDARLPTTGRSRRIADEAARRRSLAVDGRAYGRGATL